MHTCALCGTVALDTVATLTWTKSVERGREVFFCPSCTRENLRSIECRLDVEHW